MIPGDPVTLCRVLRLVPSLCIHYIRVSYSAVHARRTYYRLDWPVYLGKKEGWW